MCQRNQPNKNNKSTKPDWNRIGCAKDILNWKPKKVVVSCTIKLKITPGGPTILSSIKLSSLAFRIQKKKETCNY